MPVFKFRGVPQSSPEFLRVPLSSLKLLRAPVLGLLLLACAVRVYRLTAQSLWFDEGWSIYLARRPVVEALPLIASQGHTHPPGYYLLLHAWTLAAGASEFAVRFLSVMTGVLLVAAAYSFMRRWFGSPAALLAAGILALSPVHILYSQETRMYALLALEYLALLGLTHTVLRDGLNRNWRLWAALLTVEVAALYTHYFAGILLVYLNAFFTFVFFTRANWWQWGWGFVRRLSRRTNPLSLTTALAWAAVQALALVAYLPWLGVALRQTSEHVPRDVQPPGLAEFLSQTWHFFNAGSLGPIGHDVLLTNLSTGLGLATAVIIALDCGLRIRSPRSGQVSDFGIKAGNDPNSAIRIPKSAIKSAVGGRRSAVMLAAHGLVPLAALFVIARLRPGVHPRYVMMLSVPLFLALARGLAVLLESRHLAWRTLAVTTGALTLLTFGAGLNVAYFDGRYFRDDVRGLAHYLAETATAEDLVIFDYDDYAFRYYDRGPATTAYLSVTGDDAATVAQLAELTPGKQRVFRVAWTQGRSDYRDLLPFLLEQAGRLAGRRDFTGLSLWEYVLERPIAVPMISVANADFGAVRLTGTYVEDGAPADNAVTVGLRWHLPARTDRRLKAALRLVDPLSNVLAQSDVYLLDSLGRGTPAWSAGDDVTQYVVLPLLPGTPPLDYALHLGVYDDAHPGGLDVLDAAGAPQGREIVLGTVRLSPPTGRGADPYRVAAALALEPVDKPLASGLILDSYALDREQVNTGEKLGVRLRWHASQAPLPGYQVRVRLTRNGTSIAEAAGPPGYGRYPTTAWAAGEVVLDRRELRIPADVAPGPARLEVAIDGVHSISLAEVSITATEHVFTLPTMSYTLGRRFPGVAELLGFDVEKTLNVERSTFNVQLTLYWRALPAESAGQTAYTVFTHLLNPDGVLVGQHDGLPADGRRPTSGWVVGEVITDVHVLQLREPGYTGPALIEVGLYDPGTGTRVMADDGRDHVVLPVQVTIGR